MIGLAIPFVSANPDFPGSQLATWVSRYRTFKVVTKWGGRTVMAAAFLGATPLLLASLNRANAGNPNNQNGDLLLKGYHTPLALLGKVLAGSVIGTIPGYSAWLPQIIDKVRARVQQNPNVANVADAMLWLSEELQRAFPADLAFEKGLEEDEDLQ